MIELSQRISPRGYRFMVIISTEAMCNLARLVMGVMH